MRLIILLTAAIASGPAIAVCGQNGGPGYRDQSGKCVSWANIGSRCGHPFETRCTAEGVSEGAAKAAEFGVKAIEQRPLGRPNR